MLYADRLRTSPWIAAGCPETAGHPWWVLWAGAAMEGEQRAAPELAQRQAAFSGTGGGRGRGRR